jgi:predicted TIM-barrel fold metal-dependent hydrolase
MGAHRLPVIDADGHVYEKDAELGAHFEGRYRELKRLETFPLFPTLDGWPRALMSPHSAASITPEAWKEFLADAGLDLSVLYPTAGLAVGLIQKPEWAVAVCRAYNNWLYHTYAQADPRFRAVALLPVHEPSAAAEELERATDLLSEAAAFDAGTD